jgi:hypothetical protein
LEIQLKAAAIQQKKRKHNISDSEVAQEIDISDKQKTKEKRREENFYTSILVSLFSDFKKCL